LLEAVDLECVRGDRPLFSHLSFRLKPGELMHVTGVNGRNVPDSIQSSDQVPFIEHGVPAVQIFTGADLANLVNEATLLATRRKADAVAMDDFNNAVERIVAGLEKRNRLLNAKEREIVAYHEMGHALVAMALPGVDPVQLPENAATVNAVYQRCVDAGVMIEGEKAESGFPLLALPGRSRLRFYRGRLQRGFRGC